MARRNLVCALVVVFVPFVMCTLAPGAAPATPATEAWSKKAAATQPAGKPAPGPAKTTVKKLSSSRYMINMPVPMRLRASLRDSTLYMAAAAWPKADRKAIRKELTRLLSKDVQAFEVTEAGGVKWKVRGYDTVGLAIIARMPLRQMEVLAPKSPKGMKLKPLDKPMDRDKAKAVAEGVLARLCPDAKVRNAILVYASDDKKEPKESRNQHRFEWISRKSADWPIVRRAQVYVRAKDGLVSTLRLIDEPPGEKTITKEAMVKKAAAAKIPNYQPGRLRFQVEQYFTSAARTWQYERPAPPGGAGKDKTIWDARTGEVLYSEVIKGGKAGKPYRSPKFYFEPTEKELVTRLKALLEQEVKRLASGDKSP